MQILPTMISEFSTQVNLCLLSRPKLQEMFGKCFTNTLETTVELMEDTTFVITGDIPAMWLRDSSAQVRQYMPLIPKDLELERMVAGLIKRQMMYIAIDPYANAFNKDPDYQGHKSDITDANPWVWERKYEIDSLCYPVQLSYMFWKAAGKTYIFDDCFKNSINIILKHWKTEQRHHEESSYRFARMNCPPSDTLRNQRMGMPVNYTGMTWSAFRPSDDACRFGYLIPSNMFAVVVLGYINEIALMVYEDAEMAASAAQLQEEIRYGIETYGIYRHPEFGNIYAYETDGFGNYNLMDDANVPSLLASPYFGYSTKEDVRYRNTRRFILSKQNDYFYEGSYGKGIGSPHTPKGYIWHIGLIMQALTSQDEKEITGIIDMLEKTDAGTGFMHESFNPNNPADFTRPWFAWANSLFAELVIKLVSETSILSNLHA